jgi:pilus assembly protein CpaB
MDRRKVLLIVAVLVAALGATMVFLYVRTADSRAEERIASVDVLRASVPITPGETIEDAQAAGKLALQATPSNQVLTGAQTTTDALAGQVALTTIFPGEQIISSKFGATSAAASTLQIPEGKMAISVNLTDPARVAGFVNPGSNVAVFLSSTDQNDGAPYTRMLLDRVTVLGVGSTTPVSTTTTDETGVATTEQLPRTLLTLSLDQTQAERVLFAQSNGELAFALLTDTSAVAPGPALTATDLFPAR